MFVELGIRQWSSNKKYTLIVKIKVTQAKDWINFTSRIK